MSIRERMKEKGDQQGFTLVELIIVIAILGILAGLAVPKVGNIVGDAEKKANKANIRMIEEACDLYVASGKTELISEQTIDNNHVLIKEGYLKEEPKYPNSENKYYKIIQKDNNRWTAVEVETVPDEIK